MSADTLPFCRPPLRLIHLLALLAALGAPFPSQATSANAVTQPVQALHERLIEVMRNAETLGIEGRYRQIAPVVDQGFNIARMLRIMTGPAWKKASGSQQTALKRAFRHFTIANYAAQFSSYNGERFEALGEAPGPGKTKMVRTNLIAGSENIALTYVMHPGNAGNWRIIDILAQAGISELARRRSEYAAIIKSDGIDGLIAALERKAEVMMAK